MFQKLISGNIAESAIILVPKLSSKKNRCLQFHHEKKSQTPNQRRAMAQSQRREIRIPVTGPPKTIYGKKITGTNDFAGFFLENHMDQGGQKNSKHLSGSAIILVPTVDSLIDLFQLI